MHKQINKIAQMVRDLRDSPNHVCPNDTDDSLECTCGGYDEVIDKLTELLESPQTTTGGYCPNCNSEDIDYTGSEGDQVDSITHSMKCNDCGTIADEVYKTVFEGFENVKIP
jgi:hypothetical protein